MSHNYYLVSTCSCCGNQQVEHIGLSSVGWDFCFRALGKLDSALSWFDYIERSLTEDNVAIVDDSDDRISFDDFKNIVYASRERDGKSHGAYLEEHHPITAREMGVFYDNEGFTFLRKEFG